MDEAELLDRAADALLLVIRAWELEDSYDGSDALNEADTAARVWFCEYAKSRWPDHPIGTIRRFKPGNSRAGQLIVKAAAYTTGNETWLLVGRPMDPDTYDGWCDRGDCSHLLSSTELVFEPEA